MELKNIYNLIFFIKIICVKENCWTPIIYLKWKVAVTLRLRCGVHTISRVWGRYSQVLYKVAWETVRTGEGGQEDKSHKHHSQPQVCWVQGDADGQETAGGDQQHSCAEEKGQWVVLKQHHLELMLHSTAFCLITIFSLEWNLSLSLLQLTFTYTLLYCLSMMRCGKNYTIKSKISLFWPFCFKRN